MNDSPVERDTIPEDDLIAQIGELFEKIRAAEFPELTVEEVTDDGETFTALRCPRCDRLVDADDLYAVDFAERWTSADDVDIDSAIDYREIRFSFDELGEFGDTIYYRHDDHPVNLPDGWTEST